MFVVDARRWLALMVALSCATACYRSRAPERWLPTPAEAPTDPFGAWITLRVNAPAGPRVVDGELIAAEGDSLHILRFVELESVALADVTDVKLERFRAERRGLATWTTLGSLSALSHGLIFILSGPIWLMGGSIATAAYSYTPLVTARDIAALRPYARFPQGLPPAIERSALIAPGQPDRPNPPDR